MRWNMTLCTCDTICTSVGITQCQWYWKWHDFIPLGKTIEMKYNLVTLEHWHLCQCHMMLMASSMAPFHSLCQNDRNEHDFLVMCCYLHWHRQHVILMALSMAPLFLLGQDDWNEVQHDFSDHVMPLPLMLAPHHTISSVKEPLHSLHRNNQNEKQLDFLVMWCHWHQNYMIPMASSVAPLHSLGQDDQNKVQHDFCSCDTIGASTWGQWCH